MSENEDRERAWQEWLQKSRSELEPVALLSARRAFFAGWVEAAYACRVLATLGTCMNQLQMLDLDLEYVVHGTQKTLDAIWAEASRQRLEPARRLLKELQEELLAGKARRSSEETAGRRRRSHDTSGS
jgi:hypothetical protein